MCKKINIKKFSLILLIPLLIISFLGVNKTIEIAVNGKLFKDPSKVDSNWDVSMSFIDDGELKTNYTWNAVKVDEVKDIILQVNYKNNNAQFSYEPGDLRIVINNGFRDYKGKVIDIVSSSTGDDISVADWKLVSSGESIVLENNVAIEESSNFEGSVQVAFRTNPQYVNSGKSFDFNATLLYNSSPLGTTNNVTLNYSSNHDDFSYVVDAEKIQALDGLPANASDYIWVKYTMTIEKQMKGVRDIKLYNYRWNYAREKYPEDSLYFLYDVPSGAIALDDELNTLPVNGGKVKLTNWRYLWYKIYSYVTIGYPKAEYEHSTITGNSEVHGVYWDETEDSLLNQKEKKINLDEFAFVFTGHGDGGIRKIADKQSKVSLTKAAYGMAYAKYDFQLTYIWGGTKEDVELGDDYVYALDDKQNYVKLNSEEYKFTTVYWHGNKLYNASEKAIKPYDLELWVKYADSNEYVKYGNTLKANVDNTVSFESDENVQSYKWIIKNVEESIKPDMHSTQASYYGYVVTMEANVLINKKDLDNRSKIYNFAYLKIYQDGEWVNHGELDNYADGVTKNEIAQLDLIVHGDYLKRVVCSQDVLDNAISFQVTKKSANNGLLQNSPADEEYTGKYTISTQMGFDYGNTDSFLGVEYFDLLPKGMNATIVDNMSNPSSTLTSKIKTISGASINKDYLEDHLNIEIKENYNGTGRTLVKVLWDFRDDPLDLSINEIKNGTIKGLSLPSFDIFVSVPYESFLETGKSFENIIYMEPINLSKVNYIPYARINDYNGRVQTLEMKDDVYALKETIDLNDNGKLDYMFTSVATLEVLDLQATHQDLLTLVETTDNNYTSRNAVSSVSKNYQYKLRVRPSNNDITNLVIYDNIETAYGKNNHWQGAFDGIDLSYAEGQGYDIDVYYSDKSDAGTLSDDKSWKKYDDRVDKESVKSLAFVYKNEDGDAAYIPAKTYTYVVIKMVAPAEDSYDKAYNNSWTEWTAYKNGAVVEGVSGIVSNVVQVNLPGANVSDIPHPTGNDSSDEEVSDEIKEYDSPKTNSPETVDYILRVVALSVVLLIIIVYSVKKLKAI